MASLRLSLVLALRVLSYHTKALFDRLVVVDDFAHICAFFEVGVGVKTSLKPVDNDISKLLRRQVEVLDSQLNLVGDSCVGDGPVIRTQADAHLGVEHVSHRVLREALELRHGLEVTREADLDGDAVVGDVLSEIVDVFLLVVDAWIFDTIRTKQVITVTDAIGVEIRDGLEDTLRTISLSSVDGFFEEVFVRVLERLDMIFCGITIFLSSEVEGDDRQILFAFDRDDRLRERH